MQNSIILYSVVLVRYQVIQNYKHLKSTQYKTQKRVSSDTLFLINFAFCILHFLKHPVHHVLIKLDVTCFILHRYGIILVVLGEFESIASRIYYSARVVDYSSGGLH